MVGMCWRLLSFGGGSVGARAITRSSPVDDAVRCCGRLVLLGRSVRGCCPALLPVVHRGRAPWSDALVGHSAMAQRPTAAAGAARFRICAHDDGPAWLGQLSTLPEHGVIRQGGRLVTPRPHALPCLRRGQPHTDPQLGAHAGNATPPIGADRRNIVISATHTGPVSAFAPRTGKPTLSTGCAQHSSAPAPSRLRGTGCGRTDVPGYR